MILGRTGIALPLLAVARSIHHYRHRQPGEQVDPYSSDL